MHAMSDSFHRDRAGLRACTTSCMRLRGCLFKIKEGNKAARIADEIILDSVAGTLDTGLVRTSNVACEACSAANLTSMGPEIEAREAVSPV